MGAPYPITLRTTKGEAQSELVGSFKVIGVEENGRGEKEVPERGLAREEGFSTAADQ